MYFNVNFNVLFNPLNAELNPICHLLALLGAHHILHVSRIRVKLIKMHLLVSELYTNSWLLSVSGGKVDKPSPK